MAYQNLQSGKAKSVVPSNSENIFYSNPGDVLGCILYIGQGGTGKSLYVETVSGDIVKFDNIPSGTILPVQVVKVLEAENTCEAIVALF